MTDLEGDVHSVGKLLAVEVSNSAEPAPGSIPLFRTSWVGRGPSYWARRVLVAVFLLALYAGAGVLATFLWAKFLAAVVPAGAWRPVYWVVMALACLGSFLRGVVHQRWHPQPMGTPTEAREQARRNRQRGVRRASAAASASGRPAAWGASPDRSPRRSARQPLRNWMNLMPSMSVAAPPENTVPEGSGEAARR